MLTNTMKLTPELVRAEIAEVTQTSRRQLRTLRALLSVLEAETPNSLEPDPQWREADEALQTYR